MDSEKTLLVRTVTSMSVILRAGCEVGTLAGLEQLGSLHAGSGQFDQALVGAGKALTLARTPSLSSCRVRRRAASPLSAARPPLAGSGPGARTPAGRLLCPPARHETAPESGL